MRRCAWLLVLATVPLLAGGQPGRGDLSIAIGGLCQDYLEACGCGGRNAGGLARRAAMLTQWRAETPGAKVIIEAGDIGQRTDRLPVIARCLARLSVDVVALSAQDCEDWSKLGPVLGAHLLASTCLTPPVGPPAAGQPEVPAARTVESGGWKVGIMAAFAGRLAEADLADAVGGGVTRLRADGCQVVVLVSHLGSELTASLLAKVPADRRPTVLALATDSDFAESPAERDGVLWVYQARRARSLSTIDFTADGSRTARAALVEEGPHDPVMEAWIDEYYRRVRDGESTASPTAAQVTFPRPAACVSCHGRAVNAWRTHAHAQAVTTLEQRARDVAGCMGCHDETFRRAGVRPPASGDRGVQCATCHDKLEAHLKAPRTSKPTARDKAGCESCHTTENSPHWEYQRYRESVVGACQGRPQPRLAQPPATRG
ncbi:MAG: hypothetical protein HZB16_15910 [Armatimonadetes bacterium]|nr:hypothetical protein [Armatimonadota bacterium]